MTRLGDLRGAQLRRHRRLLARIYAHPQRVAYVRHEHEFRMAQRLHEAGLLVACVSRLSLFGGRRPFRELALFLNEADALRQYRCIMPGHGRHAGGRPW